MFYKYEIIQTKVKVLRKQKFGRLYNFQPFFTSNK